MFLVKKRRRKKDDGFVVKERGRKKNNGKRLKLKNWVVAMSKFTAYILVLLANLLNLGFRFLGLISTCKFCSYPTLLSFLLFTFLS